MLNGKKEWKQEAVDAIGKGKRRSGCADADLDAGGTSHDAGEERRVVDVGLAGEGRVERQEAGHLVDDDAGRRRRWRCGAGGGRGDAGRGRHQDVAHGGAVVKRFDGEEARDAALVLVDVLEQQAVGPDGQPRVDALGAQSAGLGVQFAQRLLDALQAVFGDVRYGRAQIQHAAPTDRRRRHFPGGRHLAGAAKSLHHHP